MKVGVVGINCRSSQIEQRESFAKTCHRFVEENPSLPLVLLSTCNRTEIYFGGDNLDEMHSFLLSALDVELELYTYFGEPCFRHLAEVTGGVDSVLFGEAEIQGQVKIAYTQSILTRSLPSPMHYLFQKSLKIGKEIRTTFSLPKGSISLESILWELACCFFPAKRTISLLLVGFSAINRKVLAFLREKKGVEITLATRSEKVREEVRERLGIATIPWQSLEEWTRFSMVVSGSKAKEYLLTGQHILKEPQDIETRLLVDLSVPRTIDPLIARHPLITLFNMEKIGEFIDRRQKVSSEEEKAIRKAIEKAVERQVELYKQKGKPQQISLCTA